MSESEIYTFNNAAPEPPEAFTLEKMNEVVNRLRAVPSIGFPLRWVDTYGNISIFDANGNPIQIVPKDVWDRYWQRQERKREQIARSNQVLAHYWFKEGWHGGFW